MKKLVMGLVMVSFLLSGCAWNKWSKADGSDSSNRKKDWRECHWQACRTPIPRAGLTHIPYFGSYYGAYWVDRFRDECMVEKGYEIKKAAPAD